MSAGGAAEGGEAVSPQDAAPLNVAVFASGGGSNFQALLDHQAPGAPWRIRVLVMNREAGAAARADAAGVPVRIIPTRDREPDEVAARTLDALEEFDVDVVLLSGYLRLLPSEVVSRYAGRILNIHPALLPAFGGQGMYGSRVHEAVLAAGARESGATVHFVSEVYDQGAILGQWRVPVRAGDTAPELAARVLRAEHRLYPSAVDHLCRALGAGDEPRRMKDVWLEEPPPPTTTPSHEATHVAASVAATPTTEPEDRPMKRALLSVSDKTGIVELGKALTDRGWQILSTGGTARALREGGVDVVSVSDVTKHPEMMDGRVKTLHPAIHAGLLARRDRDDDMSALEEHGYGPIDLVAVNLYPFRETVAKGDVPVGQAMEKVDIGGPTMIRAAAKSHRDVWVIVDPGDYAAVLEEIDAGADPALRVRLAAKVFQHISAYDAAVAEYLVDQAEGFSGDGLGERLETSLRRIQTLRYGENPDQAAAFYGPETPAGISALEQHHGKELSYNNILDLDGALLTLSSFAHSPRPAVVIIKHTTPCGLGVGETLGEAYQRALATDPLSAFGSVIAVNRPVDAPAAELMSQLFIECLVAPSYSDEAMATLTEKKNIRILTYPAGGSTDAATSSFLADHGRVPEARTLRSVYGGMLAQTPPIPPFFGSDDASWKVVTERSPTEGEWDDLRFAWAAIFGVKSNAILLARDGGVLGIGAGQMSRVDSSRIAVRKAGDAGHALDGSVLASDAFFPFRDGVDAAAEAGVRAVIQPGGSKRDEEVIAAADEHGVAMVFTGRRLFRH
jgi:phosphoribosylaminoimidazolecarboxamide formyltransferase/IMP cyclohydrolase